MPKSDAPYIRAAITPIAHMHEVWSVPMAAPPPDVSLQLAQVIQSGDVVAASTGDGVVLVAMPSGLVFRHFAELKRPLAADGAHVFARNDSGIVAINSSTGKVIWSSKACGSWRNVADIYASPPRVFVLCSSPAMLVELSAKTGIRQMNDDILRQHSGDKIVLATGAYVLVRTREYGSLSSTLIAIRENTGSTSGVYPASSVVGVSGSTVYLRQDVCANCDGRRASQIIKLRLDEHASQRRTAFHVDNVQNPKIFAVLGTKSYMVAGTTLYQGNPRATTMNPMIRGVGEAVVIGTRMIFELTLPGGQHLICVLDDTAKITPVAVSPGPTRMTASMDLQHVIAWTPNGALLIGIDGSAVVMDQACAQATSSWRDLLLAICAPARASAAPRFVAEKRDDKS